MSYFDWRWFDKKWIHKDTGTKYDPNGFDRYWLHKDTWTKFAPSWRARDYKYWNETHNFLKDASKEEIKSMIRSKLSSK